MDVRIGGGPNTIQHYLRKGLIDELHVAISPVLLGAEEQLFEGIDVRALGYECVQFIASDKATHVVLRRHDCGEQTEHNASRGHTLAPLTHAYTYATFVCMRTTLNIDDAILKKASDLTGIAEKTALVRMGLEALVARQSARRLADLGGSDPKAKHIRRRRAL